MIQRLNIFDQYSHLENRLTHALGVTLERSKSFRTDFIETFTSPGSRLKKNPRIELQLAKGSSAKDEISGIPDLALVDEDDRAIIIESKISAGLKVSQLQGHENRSRRNELKILTALAITGRDADRELVENWVKKAKLKANWAHVTWRQVYRLASKQAFLGDSWSKELQEYMNIIAHQIDEDSMDQKVKIVDFSGIPFKSYEDFDARVAKRLLRSLIDTLGEDNKFLAKLGFKKGQKPRTRKGVGKGLGVWDYLSPVAQDASHKKAHHYTVSIAQEKLAAMLTIPNGSTFRKFRKNLKKDDDHEFEQFVHQFLKNLERSNVLKSGGRPCIWIGQRRYKGQRTLFAVDGEMAFDIRTIKGQARTGKTPPIKIQPEWLKTCKQLILNKKGNVQFQIGVWFPYSHCDAIHTPKAIDLVKEAFVNLAPLANTLSH